MLQPNITQELVGSDAQHGLHLFVERGTAHGYVAGQLIHGVVTIVHVCADDFQQLLYEFLFLLS